MEADEIPIEDLEAASDALDRLEAGTFYDDEARAVEWLKNKG